jgi:hypothetical protein
MRVWVRAWVRAAHRAREPREPAGAEPRAAGARDASCHRHIHHHHHHHHHHRESVRGRRRRYALGWAAPTQPGTLKAASGPRRLASRRGSRRRAHAREAGGAGLGRPTQRAAHGITYLRGLGRGHRRGGKQDAQGGVCWRTCERRTFGDRRVAIHIKKTFFSTCGSRSKGMVQVQCMVYMYHNHNQLIKHKVIREN